jgi:hypothetical protein
MNLADLRRLERARDLLAVKGFDTRHTRLACYSGIGFDGELRDFARREHVLLVDPQASGGVLDDRG